MLKHQEISDPESCLNKAETDEPVFVLRAHDHLAPFVVLDWCDRAKRAKVNPQKVAEAYALAHAMSDWQLTNGSKTPD